MLSNCEWVCEEHLDHPWEYDDYGGQGLARVERLTPEINFRISKCWGTYLIESSGSTGLDLRGVIGFPS